MNGDEKRAHKDALHRAKSEAPQHYKSEYEREYDKKSPERSRLERDLKIHKDKADSEEMTTYHHIRENERQRIYEDKHAKKVNELHGMIADEKHRHEGARIHREEYEKRHVNRDHNTQYGHN